MGTPRASVWATALRTRGRRPGPHGRQLGHVDDGSALQPLQAPQQELYVVVWAIIEQRRHEVLQRNQRYVTGVVWFIQVFWTTRKSLRQGISNADRVYKVRVAPCSWTCAKRIASVTQ